MKKKIFLSLIGCSLLLSACGGHASPNSTSIKEDRPFSIYQNAPLSESTKRIFSTYENSLLEWFDNHDFTLLISGGSYTHAVDASYRTKVIKHSSKHNYCYYSIFNNASNNDAQYFINPYEEIVAFDENNQQIVYKYQGGVITNEKKTVAHPYYSTFLDAISYFSYADPRYFEVYRSLKSSEVVVDDELIDYFHGLGFIYSFLDHRSSNGTLIRKHEYRKLNGVAALNIEIDNYWDVDFSALNHNKATFVLTFENDLPTSLTRYIDYDQTIDSDGYHHDGYDLDIRFIYDDLKDNPFSLFGQDNSYNDITKMLIENTASYPAIKDLDLAQKIEFDASSLSHYPVVPAYPLETYVDYRAIKTGDTYNLEFSYGNYKSYDPVCTGIFDYRLEKNEAHINSCDLVFTKYDRDNCLVIPETIYKIEDSRIQHTVTSIGSYFLTGLVDDIKSVRIPSSITNIEENAFASLPKNTPIYLEHNEIPSGFEEGWCNEDAQIILSSPIPVTTPKTESYYVTKEANIADASGNIVFGVKKITGDYQYFTQNISKPILVDNIDMYDWNDVVLCSVYTLNGEGPYILNVNQSIFEYDTKDTFDFEFVNNADDQYIKITDSYYFYNGTDLSYEFEILFKSIEVFYKNGTKTTMNNSGGALEVKSKNNETRIDLLDFAFDENVIYLGMTNVSITIKYGWYDYWYFYLYSSFIKIV